MARPPFRPTAAHRRKVAAGVAGGMTQEQIAAAIGITKPTLEKYFRAELDTGAAVKRLEVIDALFAKAKRGNVSAARTLFALQPMVQKSKLDAAPADAGQADAAPAPAAAPRLGKKEIAQVHAQQVAAGRFAPSEPPKLAAVGGRKV